MPMEFTEEMVRSRAAIIGCEPTREAVAAHSEEKYGDYVEGWEIRTGRPWTTMTKAEAEELIRFHPQCSRNPGVLSRLLGN